MKHKQLFVFLLILGVIYRFYFQFIQPAFNVDEIALGNNLKELNYFELLKPLRYGQSSPPLFLWIQKFISTNPLFPFWINIKIISFLVSIITISYFYKFISRYNFDIVLIIPFIILLFNPFVIYNSLTLKQYTFDLLGVVLLVNYFEHIKFKKIAPLFFLVWSLISNIGIFSCVGYLLYLLVIDYKWNYKNQVYQIFLFLKKNVLLVCSTLPYVIYFLWFMKQDGAFELEKYMMLYWADSFIPFNQSFLNYFIFQIHGFWSYFYNMLEAIGVLIFLLTFLPFLYQIAKRRKLYLQKEIFLCFCIFLVHLVLNVLKMYPLSDRLYLYLSLLFVLLLASSIHFLCKTLKIKTAFISFGLCIVCLVGYSQYFDYKENDVKSLISYLDSKSIKEIYVTNVTKQSISNFHNFTNNYFVNDLSFLDIDNTLLNSKYLVSRVHNKLKPDKTSMEEPFIEFLLYKNRISFIKNIDGFNLYQIKQ